MEPRALALLIFKRTASRTPGLDVMGWAGHLERGLAHLFPVGRESGIIGTLLVDRRAQIVAAAGEMRELLAALPYVEHWYRALGARSLELQGRAGWVRVLGPFGYRRDGDKLIKGLS